MLGYQWGHRMTHLHDRIEGVLSIYGETRPGLIHLWTEALEPFGHLAEEALKHWLRTQDKAPKPVDIVRLAEKLGSQ
jgi:hypothetical protein